MKAFVAREPIFDAHLSVYGYELRVESGLNGLLERPDADLAVLKAIDNSLFLFGIEVVSGLKRTFLQFTRETLLQGYALLFPARAVVVEVGPEVELDEPTVAACHALKRSGYMLAASQVVAETEGHPLFPLVDVLRVDFRRTPGDERALLVRRGAPRGMMLLAEHVADHDELRRARDLGYTYFQGAFFGRPVVVEGHQIPAATINYLSLLQEINRPELDLDQIEEVLKREVALCYKLLRCINSVAFGLRHRVNSVRQAILLLGERGIRKWASLVVMAGLNQRGPSELVAASLQRARFAEMLVETVDLKDRSEEAFLMGLFSMLDVIIGRPFDEILEGLPLAPDVKQALLGGGGAMRYLLDLVLAYEAACWKQVAVFAADMGIAQSDVVDAYLRSTEWSNSVAAA